MPSQGREGTVIQEYLRRGSYPKLYNYPNRNLQIFFLFFEPGSNQGSLIIFDVNSP